MFVFRRSSSARRGILAAVSVVGLAAVSLSLLMLAFGGSPSSAASAVNLGTAQSFGVLAGSAVTNTGDSVISGDLGVSPETSVTGFPPGQVLGTIHSADAVAGQAQTDLTTAYNAVAAQPLSESISADLGGRTLTSGVYNSASSLGLTGELTLDAQGDAGAVFIFQAGSTLITASGSDVTLVNGAQACNVFWQVGSSATLGTGSTFIGSVLALTSISAGTGTTVAGRLLARNGAVTLDNNTITPSACTTPTTGVPTTDVPTTDVPTTDVPTTDVPTTDVATTDVPTTDVSTTDVPTTDVATTDVPTTDVPTTDVPTVQVPAVPVVEQPPTDKPGPKDSTIPKGVPNTGDGGSVHVADPGLLWAGGLILGLAGASLLWRRRDSSTS